MGVFEYFEVLFDDGGDFVMFCVNYIGEVSELFSNIVVELDLVSKFNSIVV